MNDFSSKARTSEVLRKLTQLTTSLEKDAPATHVPLNLCFGVCRSGTTALAQVFGKAGCKSFYQPIKSDCRLIAFSKLPSNILALMKYNKKSIFVKETIGPLRQFEYSIDFLDVYHRLGFDLEMAHIILAFRHPSATFGSWLRKWGSKTSRRKLLIHYIASERALTRLELKSKHMGLNISYFACHVGMTNHQTFRTLFSRSKPKITYDESYFQDWRIPNFHESRKIEFGSEPRQTVVSGLHNTEDHYYSEERFLPAIFTRSEAAQLVDAQIDKHYYQRLALASIEASKVKFQRPGVAG